MVTKNALDGNGLSTLGITTSLTPVLPLPTYDERVPNIIFFVPEATKKRDIWSPRTPWKGMDCLPQALQHP